MPFGPMSLWDANENNNYTQTYRVSQGPVFFYAHIDIQNGLMMRLMRGWRPGPFSVPNAGEMRDWLEELTRAVD